MNISHASSSATLDELTNASSNLEEDLPSNGNLEGKTITVVDHEKPSFPSLSSVSSFLSEATTKESPITIRDVNTPFFSDSATPSPVPPKKEIPHLKVFIAKKEALQEKIKSIEEVSLPENNEYEAELKEHHQEYISHLKMAQRIMEETISFHEEALDERNISEATESYESYTIPSLSLSQISPEEITKIEKTVDTIISLAEKIQSHRSFLREEEGLHRLKERPTGSIGIAREGISHYCDYANSLKNKNTSESIRDAYLGDSCVASFDQIDATLKGNTQIASSYAQASSSFRTAANLSVSHPDLAILSKNAGNYFLQAANAYAKNSPEVAELYSNGGKYTQRAVTFQELKEDPPYQNTELLESAGAQFLNAAEALQQGKRPLAETYKAAGIYYIDSFKVCREPHLFNPFEISGYLAHAANCFSNAAEALKYNKEGLYELHSEAGSCFLEVVNTMTTLRENRSKKIELLGNASSYFLQSAEELTKAIVGKSNRSQLYKMVGECAKKAAMSSNLDVKRELENTLQYCSILINELDKGSSEEDKIVQLFRSAIKYSRETVALLETETYFTNQNTAEKIQLFHDSAFHLSEAGKALQKGNEALASQYHDLAASKYALGEAIQPTSNPDGNQNENLITYWSQIVASHEEKLKKMLTPG